MYSKGHVGLTLLIASIIMMPFGYSENSILIIAFSAGLSVLPDIDMGWRRYGVHHRGPTHSILFAVICGVLFGFLLHYANETLLWFGIGFVSAFLGVVSHLIGDTFTYHAFKPLWPFSDRAVSLGFCSAGDRSVNEGLMAAGTISLIAYFLVKTGALGGII